MLNSGQVGHIPVMKGDRIFVAKCVYQFTDPKRWDVVVFKNPVDPRINYIKRMVGLPNEEIEIIDGDVYADGKITRKPKGVQDELWMCVYDNDYQPSRPSQKRFNGRSWSQPFVNDINANGIESKWDLSADGPTVFSLSSDSGEINSIVYDTSLGNDFRATYAYDDPRQYGDMPICSDLMVRFYVRKSAEGIVGIDLRKYGKRYRGWVDSGNMFVGYYDDNGKVVVLDSKSVDISGDDKVILRFANVDHRLVLEYGDEELASNLGDSPDSLGQRKAIMPRVSIFGGGEIELSHVGVFRDIHYIGHIPRRGPLRASEGNAFKLEADQFFVLGDNSPASADSRYWAIEGLGNSETRYRMGTVPRDYLVGKAFFVYWPGPFRPSDKFIRIIPHVEGMKIIKGGRHAQN